jgi:hypothetical protein
VQAVSALIKLVAVFVAYVLPLPDPSSKLTLVPLQEFVEPNVPWTVVQVNDGLPVVLVVMVPPPGPAIVLVTVSPLEVKLGSAGVPPVTQSLRVVLKLVVFRVPVAPLFTNVPLVPLQAALPAVPEPETTPHVVGNEVPGPVPLNAAPRLIRLPGALYVTVTTPLAALAVADVRLEQPLMAAASWVARSLFPRPLLA